MGEWATGRNGREQSAGDGQALQERLRRGDSQSRASSDLGSEVPDIGRKEPKSGVALSAETSAGTSAWWRMR
jgi:hypothetical protein